MRRLALAILLVVLGCAPFVNVGIPFLFTSEVSSPGSLQILAIALVYAGFAVSYDIVFGFTGLLSFGHALPIALGAYGTNLFMIHAGLAYPLAVVASLVATVLISTLLGAIALRTTGVAFAMVTLAFAEAFAILILSDPLRVFGGEEGLQLASGLVPDFFRGVFNTRNLYWFALGFLLLTYVVGRRVVSSRAGKVWEAIRENEARVHMVGLEPFRFKLASFVIASALASLGGSIYILLVRGANTGIASATFTLALLVMVVLGGPGRLWGAALGGFVYAILSLRLSAVSTSQAIADLPDWIEGPLSEPLFVLGVLFVLMMLFAPGGIASITDRLRRPDRSS
ncbi:MAG: branched-chain amino acid ABC transporter permease [Acidimicrobiia bacterium]